MAMVHGAQDPHRADLGSPGDSMVSNGYPVTDRQPVRSPRQDPIAAHHGSARAERTSDWVGIFGPSRVRYLILLG